MLLLFHGTLELPKCRGEMVMLEAAIIPMSISNHVIGERSNGVNSYPALIRKFIMAGFCIVLLYPVLSHSGVRF